MSASSRNIRYRPFLLEKSRNFSAVDAIWSLKHAKILPPESTAPQSFPTVVAPPSNGYQDAYPSMRKIDLSNSSLLSSSNTDLRQSNETQQKCVPRCDFAVCMTGGRIYLHGGAEIEYEILSDNDDEDSMNIDRDSDFMNEMREGCIWMLDSTSSSGWQKIVPSSPSAARPAPRSKHSLHFLGPNMLLLYGGLLEDETPKNDMWVFDLSALKWSCIDHGAISPQPADEPALLVQPPANPSMKHYGLIFFGGREKSELWTAQLDLDSLRISWRKIDTKCPNLRSGATWVRIDDDNLFLVGGYTRERPTATPEPEEYEIGYEDDDIDMMDDEDDADNELIRVGVTDPLWMLHSPSGAFLKLSTHDFPEKFVVLGCDRSTDQQKRNAFRIFGIASSESDDAALLEYLVIQSDGNTFLEVESSNKISDTMIYNHPVLHDSAIKANDNMIRIQRSIVFSKSSNYLQAMLSGAWTQSNSDDGLPLAALPAYLSDYENEFEGLLKLIHGIQDPIDPLTLDPEDSLADRSAQCCAQAINIALLAEQLSMIELPLLLYNQIGRLITSNIAQTQESFLDPHLFANIFQGHVEPEDMAFKLLKEFINIEHSNSILLSLSYSKRLILELGYRIPDATYSLMYEKFVDPKFMSYHEERHMIKVKEYAGPEADRDRAREVAYSRLSKQYQPVFNAISSVFNPVILADWGDVAHADRLYNAVFHDPYINLVDLFRQWCSDALHGARKLIYRACENDADANNSTGYWTLYQKFYHARCQVHGNLFQRWGPNAHMIEFPSDFIEIERPKTGNRLADLLVSTYEASHSSQLHKLLQDELQQLSDEELCKFCRIALQIVSMCPRVAGDDGRAARNVLFGFSAAYAAMDRSHGEFFQPMVEHIRLVVDEELRGSLVLSRLWLMCSGDFYAEIIRFLPLSSVCTCLAREIAAEKSEIYRVLLKVAEPPAQRGYPEYVKQLSLVSILHSPIPVSFVWQPNAEIPDYIPEELVTYGEDFHLLDLLIWQIQADGINVDQLAKFIIVALLETSPGSLRPHKATDAAWAQAVALAIRLTRSEHLFQTDAGAVRLPTGVTL